MNAESKKIRDTLADQLASFDDRLEAQSDDVKMLAEIEDGIASLLSDSGSSEADIRGVLHERYEAGALRKETFQLVKSMLDRFVTEDIPTSPLPGKEDREQEDASKDFVDDVFASTIVIPDAALEARAAEQQVQVGSLLRDRFLLQEKVAGGSMGVVYKALDRRLAEAGTGNAWVAIKVLSPQLSRNATALKALQQEAAKGRCLVHENIVRFMDLDRDDELYFIVMEWLDGKNLAEILDDAATRKLEPQQAFKIVRQIGAALTYAHRCGIVHADVKPGNIMIMPDGDAKLFDFGVARVQQSQLISSSAFDPKELGAITPAYASMQVLTGEEPVPSDDVFSLACLLYRLLAGYRVFGPRNAAEAAEQGMKPQKLDMLSDGQWRAVKKALSYPRVTRFDSMQEFVDALEAGISDETISLEVERDFEVEEPGGFGKWLLALVMLAGLAGVAANQLGYLDELKAQILGEPFESAVVQPVASEPGPSQDTQEAAEETAGAIEAPAENEPDPETNVEPEVVAEEVVLPEAAPAQQQAPVEPPNAGPAVFDFTTLPPATLQIAVSVTAPQSETHTLTLVEDSDGAVVEIVRADTRQALTLRLEEVGFSGNRSPWATGQFTISDDSLVTFPVGQSHGRVRLKMQPDSIREADQLSTIRIRDVDRPNSELAKITVFLRDDDQALFDEQLPPNTIAFTSPSTTVSESDPAVQLDVQRFNPDSSSVLIGYRISSVSAFADEDYFIPGVQEITFGPGQRTARLLIPLVRDVLVEGDETFEVELLPDQPVESADVFQLIRITIQDNQ